MNLLTTSVDFREKKHYITGVAPKLTDEELQTAQGKLLKLALMAYESILTAGTEVKDEIKKAAADKVFEMHGLIGKSGGGDVAFHLNIPPEYFGTVLRGLEHITVQAKAIQDRQTAEDAEYRELDHPPEKEKRSETLPVV